MDYKEKYNEALKRATFYNNELPTKEQRKMLLDIFPELKSEDERIKREILELVSIAGNGNQYEEIKDWLEKQGEQKPNPYSGTSFEYNGHIWGMCARDNGVEILFDGELKAFLSLEKSFIYPIYPKPDLAHKSDIEAIKDNVGNNNKVEPKFHSGDWITDGYIYYKITEILDDRYIIESKYDKRGAILFEFENRYHLWTINDAKDGDVLMTTKTRNCPFIYRKTCFKNNLAYYYVGIDGDGYLARAYPKKMLDHFGPTSNVIPATKEQRDILFDRIKKAGYEWDSEKKELKKIEHKKLDADKVIAWLVANISDFEYYVKLFKKDFGL